MYPIKVLSMPSSPLQIAILGAGSIGCYVGGCLASAGGTVTLIGRERVLKGIRDNGLTVSDYKSRKNHVPSGKLTLSDDASACTGADVILVCVKSAATEEAAVQVQAHVKQDAAIVSFQNGIDNAQRLRATLPGVNVLSGMVPFNVIDRGNGAFHQGSAGDLEVEAGVLPDGVAALFSACHLPLLRPADMAAVRWGKLLLNLNNPVNALSGIPLREELSQRDFRRCLALAQREALQLMKACNITPAKVTPLPPAWLPTLLNTPDWLFTRAAKRMLAIDPLARSSMWEDLQLGRPTEIDWINGEVLELAKRCGKQAPVNAMLVKLIRDAEKGGRRNWRATELLEALSHAG
jgi:2-dehydropantoate 2-reductase